MFTTGNNTVDLMGQMHLEGNVIPHMWYENFRLDSGKPDLNAIIILAEIVYWYRPSYEKDEVTGRLINIKKKFKSDLLQLSYDRFAEQFSFSKKQVKEAMDRLENRGIIKRDFRTINANRTRLSNVLFIDLNVPLLERFTFSSGNGVLPQKVGWYSPQSMEGGDLEVGRVQPSRVRGGAPQVGTYTKITTEITNTEITNKKNSSRKRVYDESSVHYQLAYRLYQKILIDDPSFKQPNMNTWADCIRLMMEQDDRTAEQIEYLIDWSQANSFWKSNILSTKKLREKATTLIRQIKAENAKENKAKSPSPIKHRQGRTEVVPEWFHKRNEDRAETVEVSQEIDFEAERQKILETLGRIDKNAQ